MEAYSAGLMSQSFWFIEFKKVVKLISDPPCAAKAAIPCVPAAKRNPLCGFPFSSGFIEALTHGLSADGLSLSYIGLSKT